VASSVSGQVGRIQRQSFVKRNYLQVQSEKGLPGLIRCCPGATKPGEYFKHVDRGHCRSIQDQLNLIRAMFPLKVGQDRGGIQQELKVP